MDGEQATIFNERLQMAIGLWFLPEGIHFRLAAFLDDESKTRCFYFEQFHSGASVPLAIPSKRKPEARATLSDKTPPENYGKEDQTTVAAFLPWRGSQVFSP